jgi:hypothetical protein
VAENMAVVQLSSQSCPMERSESDAQLGEMVVVHVSAEKEGKSRLAV